MKRNFSVIECKIYAQTEGKKECNGFLECSDDTLKRFAYKIFPTYIFNLWTYEHMNFPKFTDQWLAHSLI